jgi:hypothetical protein
MSTLYVDSIEPKTTGGIISVQASAFMAQKGDVTTYSTTGNITFNTTHLANSAWNGTTFTIPKAGIYRFFVNGHHNSLSTTAIELSIKINGTIKVSAYSLNNSSVRQRAFCELIFLFSANDAITFGLEQGDVYAGSGTSGVTCGGQYLGSQL